MITKSIASPAPERMITGLRPIRSDSMPSTGAATKLATAQIAESMPSARATSTPWPGDNLPTSAGRIGKMIPIDSPLSMTMTSRAAKAASKKRSPEMRSAAMCSRDLPDRLAWIGSIPHDHPWRRE